MSNWPGLVGKDDPDFHNPLFQRRILSLRRVISFVSNIHEATLECGHEPLVLGDNPMPKVGMNIFCGDCRDADKSRDAEKGQTAGSA